MKLSFPAQALLLWVMNTGVSLVTSIPPNDVGTAAPVLHSLDRTPSGELVFRGSLEGAGKVVLEMAASDDQSGSRRSLHLDEFHPRGIPRLLPPAPPLREPGFRHPNPKRLQADQRSLTAAQTISNTRRNPSSPPRLPSLNGVRGMGFQLSREVSTWAGWGTSVKVERY